MNNRIKLNRIFEDANCFYECAKRVLGEKNEKGSIDIIKNSQVLILKTPFCVNIAFACELYFKMLILNNGTTIPHTHKLYELYGSLLKKQQKTLCSLFNKPEEAIEESEAKFLSSLKASSDLFEKYRYGFENDNLPSIKVMFILNLTEYLYNMCLNIKEKMNKEFLLVKNKKF